MNRRSVYASIVGVGLSLLIATAACAGTFAFSTGNTDGKMGMLVRPTGAGGIETETGDDFILTSQTSITSVSFTGLLTDGSTLTDIDQVVLEIYRVFPRDSQDPPSGHVPTRQNSPSDVAFVERDLQPGSFSASEITNDFTVANTVVNGINPSPNQRTGGEGPALGHEVLISVSLPEVFNLPADHYFFVPQVAMEKGNFLWLSAPKPIVPPGTPFSPDLQAWIRNENLAPDWLRVGTDIVGGETPPTFNASFSLAGTTNPAIPLPPAAWPALATVGAAGVFRARKVLTLLRNE